MPNGERFSRTKELAIAALLSQATITKAAAKVKISERTLRNWMKQPRFARAYRAARQEILDRATAQILGICGLAVAALKRNLKCNDPSVETRTAIAVLSQAAGLRKHVEFAERLTAMEEQMRDLAGRGAAPRGLTRVG